MRKKRTPLEIRWEWHEIHKLIDKLRDAENPTQFNYRWRKIASLARDIEAENLRLMGSVGDLQMQLKQSALALERAEIGTRDLNPI